MTFRLGHYAITNQGKDSAPLVRTIVFNFWGYKKSEIKVYILKLY